MTKSLLPLISVLMPVKNASDYILECIKSVQAQSLTNWELIVVDDHSRDNTRDIIKSIAADDNRIQLLKNKGSGIIPALQLALENSAGQYISRMDGDDIMGNHKLMALVNNLIEYGPGYIAVGKVKYFSDTTLGSGYKKYEKWINDLVGSGDLWSDIYKECVVPSPCWMVHRDDLQKAGAFDSPVYPEDYDLCFRFYKAGLIPIPSNKVLHFWRDYPHRTSRVDPLYADNRFLELKCKYFIELEHQEELILWGAGKKAKIIAKILLSNSINFHWVTNNLKKVDHIVYGVSIKAQYEIEKFPRANIIIAVANEEAQTEIRDFLAQSSNSNPEQHYFFC